MRSESWFCFKICIVCGAMFRGRSGFSKVCADCKAKPCPRCGRPVRQWSCGVCSSCRSHERHAADPEVRSQQGREYYAKNRGALKAKSALYRRLYPDKIKAMSARYIQENRDEISKRTRERDWALRLQAVSAYGGECDCCGETEPKFLCIHHVNGGGKRDRSLGYAGVSMFAKLRREGWPKEGYRLLCHNCNNAIRILGYCPHQTRYSGNREVTGVHMR